jgi:hypothetical protein
MQRRIILLMNCWVDADKPKVTAETNNGKKKGCLDLIQG